MPQLLDFVTRHPLLVGATAATLAAALATELMLRGRSVGGVSPQQAVRLINQGAAVLDLRDKASFDARHIVDATPMSAEDVTADAQGKLKKKKVLLLVCETGARSGRLVGTLRRSGVDNAFSLSGGLAAWEKDNLPLVATKTKG
jgi:rhodanese-related sulfurtransferase